MQQKILKTSKNWKPFYCTCKNKLKWIFALSISVGLLISVVPIHVQAGATKPRVYYDLRTNVNVSLVREQLESLQAAEIEPVVVLDATHNYAQAVLNYLLQAAMQTNLQLALVANPRSISQTLAKPSELADLTFDYVIDLEQHISYPNAIPFTLVTLNAELTEMLAQRRELTTDKPVVVLVSPTTFNLSLIQLFSDLPTLMNEQAVTYTALRPEAKYVAAERFGRFVILTFGGASVSFALAISLIRVRGRKKFEGSKRNDRFEKYN